MRTWTQIVKDQGAAALTEFALILPVLLALLFGAVELTRFITINMKLQSVVMTMGDLVSREETLSADQLSQLFLAVGHVLEPFDGATNGVAIVSAVSAETDGSPLVYWQSSGGGGLVSGSEVGAPDGAANLPIQFTVRAGETIIVVEAYYRYESLLSGIIPTTTLRKVGYFRPRLGSLQELS